MSPFALVVLLSLTAPRGVTLAEAEARAVDPGAPAMAEALAAADEAKAGIGVARGIEDPTVSVGTSRLSAKETLGVGVSLPLFGQQIPETRAAKESARAAEAGVDLARLGARAAADRAWFALWEAEALGGLARQALDDATRLRDAAQERFDAGDVPKKDVVQAAAELARAKAEAAGAEADRLGAAAQLAVLVGLPVSEPVSAIGPLPEPGRAVLPDPDALGALLDASPGAVADEHAIAAARARLNAARLGWLPRVGLDFTMDRDDPGLSGTDYSALATLAIPVGGRHGPAIHAAAAAFSREKAAAQGASLRRRGDAFAALRTAESARARLAAFDDEAVPAAQTAYDMAEEAYRDGEIGLLEVVAARRTLASVRAERIAAFTAAANALVDLTHATGKSYDAATP